MGSLIDKTPDEYPQAYLTGVNARNAGMKKEPPGYSKIVNRYWWLAGWNDRDIELGGDRKDAAAK